MVAHFTLLSQSAAALQALPKLRACTARVGTIQAVVEKPRMRKRDRVKRALGDAARRVKSARRNDRAEVPYARADVVSWYDSGVRLGAEPIAELCLADLSGGGYGVEGDAEPREDDLTESLLLTIRAEFAGELQPAEERWLTPETAAIYVERCRGKPEEKRVQMLSNAVRWRIQRRSILSSRECPTCSREPRAHDARIFGQDGDGDVVIMNCFALSRDYSPSGVSDHLACLFERAIEQYPATEQGRRRWTWVIDVHGFGLQHTDPRVALEMVTLLESAYPERLKVSLKSSPPAPLLNSSPPAPLLNPY